MFVSLASGDDSKTTWNNIRGAQLPTRNAAHPLYYYLHVFHCTLLAAPSNARLGPFFEQFLYVLRQAGRQAGKHTMLQVCENCHSQECCFFRIVFTAFEHPALPRLVELRRCNMPRITMCCSVSAYQHGSCTPRPLTFGSLAGWSPRAGGANASPGQPDKKSLFISIIMGEQHTNSLVSRIHVQTLKVHC